MKEKLLRLMEAKLSLIKNATEFSKQRALTKVQTTLLSHFAHEQ